MKGLSVRRKILTALAAAPYPIKGAAVLRRAGLGETSAWARVVLRLLVLEGLVRLDEEGYSLVGEGSEQRPRGADSDA